MRFTYATLRTRQPVFSLGGLQVRRRPIIPIHIIGPQVLSPIDGCIDSAADDTIFPSFLAQRLGINPSGGPQGQLQPVGRSPLTVVYASVTLLLADGYETCEWDAIVGFTTAPLPRRFSATRDSCSILTFSF